MPLWILFTLGAIAFQVTRFALQKTLAQRPAAGGGLSAGGATFARFLFSAPLVWIVVALSGLDWPALPAAFYLQSALGAATQVLATVCVVLLFKARNFTVGVTFKKTEVLMTAAVGLILLGEGVSLGALLVILVGLGGVLLLSRTPGSAEGLFTRAAGLGLASGLFFAISAVSYRAASLMIEAEAPVRALITLCTVVTCQLVGMAAWLRLREPGEISRTARAWRTTGLVGLTSLAGSYCWFTAFTLHNAAIVNAVGQLEVVASLMVSVVFFRERLSRREGFGIALVTLSVVALVLMS